MMKHKKNNLSGFRRLAGRALVSGALALSLAACGGNPADDGEVELRFAWWGGDVRQQITQEVIDAYEVANPGVSISGEYSDFGGYWDKLATTVAAGDAPDIIQMDISAINEYMGRGALLPIPESVDTSKIEASALDSGRTDKGLAGVPNGVNTYAVFANPAIFEEAGVPLPDDETWTWEDYESISKEITARTNGEIHGSSLGFPDTLSLVARQKGESLFTEDGQIGISKETLTEYWETLLNRVEEGVLPPATANVENMDVGVEQTHFAQGKTAMTFDWSNLLTATSDALGSEVAILRLPSMTGNAEEAHAAFKASQFWSIGSTTEHPEEAAKFIDYLINSEEAAMILKAERGAPPNNELRPLVAEEAEPADAKSLEFISAIADEVGPAQAALPVGGGSNGEIYYRYATEVMFERLTPAEAAEGYLNDLAANLQ